MRDGRLDANPSGIECSRFSIMLKVAGTRALGDATSAGRSPRSQARIDLLAALQTLNPLPGKACPTSTRSSEPRHFDGQQRLVGRNVVRAGVNAHLQQTPCRTLRHRYHWQTTLAPATGSAQILLAAFKSQCWLPPPENGQTNVPSPTQFL